MLSTVKKYGKNQIVVNNLKVEDEINERLEEDCIYTFFLIFT